MYARVDPDERSVDSRLDEGRIAYRLADLLVERGEQDQTLSLYERSAARISQAEAIAPGDVDETELLSYVLDRVGSLRTAHGDVDGPWSPTKPRSDTI